ncbi:unnamed protein product, partial [Closterium sp. Naga37s-1]
DLSDNQLSGNIPTTFGALIQMEFLDLSNNQLEDVPSILGALSAMTYLGLRSNKLSGAIPPSIALLKYINAL